MYCIILLHHIMLYPGERYYSFSHLSLSLSLFSLSGEKQIGREQENRQISEKREREREYKKDNEGGFLLSHLS